MHRGVQDNEVYGSSIGKAISGIGCVCPCILYFKGIRVIHKICSFSQVLSVVVVGSQSLVAVSKFYS